MRIKLRKDIHQFDGAIRLKKGEIFDVHPEIERFRVPVHEIKSGPHTGIMLPKEDCDLFDDK